MYMEAHAVRSVPTTGNLCRNPTMPKLHHAFAERLSDVVGVRKELAIRCGLRGCVAIPFQVLLPPQRESNRKPHKPDRLTGYFLRDAQC